MPTDEHGLSINPEIDFGEPDKEKVPSGYEVCYAIIGFDSMGQLRIAESDEEWEPEECEKDFFVGPIQRLVFYRVSGYRPPAPIQYFIMDTLSSGVRNFHHFKEQIISGVGQLPPAPGNKPDPLEVDNTGDYVMGYGFYNGGPRGAIFEQPSDVKREEPKTADSLLSDLLKKPIKTIFDKD